MERTANAAIAPTTPSDATVTMQAMTAATDTEDHRLVVIDLDPLPRLTDPTDTEVAVIVITEVTTPDPVAMTADLVVVTEIGVGTAATTMTREIPILVDTKTAMTDGTGTANVNVNVPAHLADLPAPRVRPAIARNALMTKIAAVTILDASSTTAVTLVEALAQLRVLRQLSQTPR